MQWHTEIGMFNPTHKTRFINLCLGICDAFVFLMLFACGDIEHNPGPKRELLLQFLSLPLEFKYHHCTQFCKNRSSPSL